jgi:hypothetical protein
VVASDVAALALIQSLEKRPQGQKWDIAGSDCQFLRRRGWLAQKSGPSDGKGNAEKYKGCLGEFEELLVPVMNPYRKNGWIQPSICRLLLLQKDWTFSRIHD